MEHDDLEVVKTPKHDISFDFRSTLFARRRGRSTFPPQRFRPGHSVTLAGQPDDESIVARPIVTALPTAQGPSIPFVGLLLHFRPI
jgi:hypothetical protein